MAKPHQINPDADITTWKALGDSYVIASRDGEIIANTNLRGLLLILFAAAATGMSVFDHDTQQFNAGDVGQLTN